MTTNRWIKAAIVFAMVTIIAIFSQSNLVMMPVLAPSPTSPPPPPPPSPLSQIYCPFCEASIPDDERLAFHMAEVHCGGLPPQHHTLAFYDFMGQHFRVEASNEVNGVYTIYITDDVGSKPGYICPIQEEYIKRKRDLTTQIQTYKDTIEDLRGQLIDLNSTLNLRTRELESVKMKISELESQLQAPLNKTKEAQTRLANALDAANRKISDLESQVKDLLLRSSSLQNTVAEVERRNSDLQSTLNSSTYLTYIAIGIAIIAVIFVAVIAVVFSVVMALRRRTDSKMID